MSTNRWILIGALVAALFLAAPAAGAATYKTKIVVSLKFPAFHGVLQSPKGSCASNRTVKLYREKSGPDKQLGTDTSNRDGKWSIPIGKRLISGAYYAKAPARGNCKSSKSKVTAID
jgi:hypothetical protein